MITCRDIAHDRILENLAPVVGVGGIKRVVKSKVWPSDADDLPVLGIYFANEILTFKSGHVPGRRIVQRVMNFYAVGVFARPLLSENTLEADQGAVMAAVEMALAGDPLLRRDGVPLLSDQYVTQGGTGYDAESGVTVALAAMSIVAVAHHREGRPDLTLPQAAA